MNQVKEKNGFNEVTKAKLWKEISAALNIQASASAAFNVRKKYVSLGIFHYECKFDLNGTDPLPIIAEMEKTAQAQKKPPKSANSSVNEAGVTGSPGEQLFPNIEILFFSIASAYSKCFKRNFLVLLFLVAEI